MAVFILVTAKFSHCPVSDLNPFAREQVIIAMQTRIAAQEDKIKRALKKQKDGKPLWWINRRIGKSKKNKKIGFNFFCWSEDFLPPEDIIADAKERIEELSND